MQLTPETAAEIHRIFDDPEPEDPNETELDESRFADEEPYAPRSARLVEIRALLAWIAGDETSEDELDDEYGHLEPRY